MAARSTPYCSTRLAPLRASCAVTRMCAGCGEKAISRNSRPCRRGCSRPCGHCSTLGAACFIAPVPYFAPRGKRSYKRLLHTTPALFCKPPPAIYCPKPGQSPISSRTISKVITTVFITHCWQSVRGMSRLRSALERACWRLLACCVLVLALPATAQGPQAEIEQLRLERTEEGVLLSANVVFEVPPIIDDALAKGIPMFFVAEAVLFRDRWYWYDKQTAAAARYVRLSYQPLTRRWRLVVSPTPIGNSGLALGQTFETREEALAAVQHISHWKIAEATDIDPDARYNLDYRFRLDISQLPRPFQIGAVGHADWNITASRNLRLS